MAEQQRSSAKRNV